MECDARYDRGPLQSGRRPVLIKVPGLVRNRGRTEVRSQMEPHSTPSAEGRTGPAETASPPVAMLGRRPSPTGSRPVPTPSEGDDARGRRRRPLPTVRARDAVASPDDPRRRPRPVPGRRLRLKTRVHHVSASASASARRGVVPRVGPVTGSRGDHLPDVPARPLGGEEPSGGPDPERRVVRVQSPENEDGHMARSTLFADPNAPRGPRPRNPPPPYPRFWIARCRGVTGHGDPIVFRVD